MLVGLLAVALLVAARIDRLASLAVGGLPLRVVFYTDSRNSVLASSSAPSFSFFSSLPGSLDIPRCCYVVARGNNERRRRVLETNRVAPRGPRGDTKKRHRAGPTARL